VCVCAFVCVQEHQYAAVAKHMYKDSMVTVTGNSFFMLSIYILYDYMPKGVQEKRTEVLENKVDRMRMNNAFSERTHVKSSTSFP